MKGLLLFTLLTLLSTAISLSPEINNSTRPKAVVLAPQRQQRRRNYCFNNLEKGGGGGQVQDQFPFYLDNTRNTDFGGVAHLLATIYQYKSLYQSCQPILLSFSSSHNSSGSHRGDTMADFNRKNVDIVDIIRTFLERKPILYFQLKLSKQENPTLSLPQQNTKELLKKPLYPNENA